MLSEYYFIDIEANGYCWLAFFIGIVVYHYFLVQLAPYIKKSLGVLYDKIVKRDKKVGFK